MQVTILSARTGWHTDELCRALAGRGHGGHVVPYEGLVARLGTTAARVAAPAAGAPSRGPLSSGTLPGGMLSSGTSPLLSADAVFARIIPAGSLEQIIFRVDALHWIEERGIPVINSPRAIERSVDKFYTDALLNEANLATPETVVCESVDEGVAAVARMGEAIIKPIFGSMGHGLVRVGDPDTAYRVLRALAQVRAVFYVQRALPAAGRDIRVFVVGGRVLAAIERRAPGGDWRSNVSRGGSATPFELPDAWAEIACRAAAAVGADYAGVDLLPVDDQVYVLEVNGIPGWEGLQRATGIDVADALVAHLESRVAGAVRCEELAQ